VPVSATPYTLSLPDALPISRLRVRWAHLARRGSGQLVGPSRSPVVQARPPKPHGLGPRRDVPRAGARADPKPPLPRHGRDWTAPAPPHLRPHGCPGGRPRTSFGRARLGRPPRQHVPGAVPPGRRSASLVSTGGGGGACRAHRAAASAPALRRVG